MTKYKVRVYHLSHSVKVENLPEPISRVVDPVVFPLSVVQSFKFETCSLHFFPRFRPFIGMSCDRPSLVYSYNCLCKSFITFMVFRCIFSLVKLFSISCFLIQWKAHVSLTKHKEIVWLYSMDFPMFALLYRFHPLLLCSFEKLISNAPTNDSAKTIR